MLCLCLSCHGIPETENEEIVINDKQVDNMNASKFQNNNIYFYFIRMLLCFEFLSIPIVRLYRVLLINCFNGLFRGFKFINLKLFFGIIFI